MAQDPQNPTEATGNVDTSEDKAASPAASSGHEEQVTDAETTEGAAPEVDPKEAEKQKREDGKLKQTQTKLQQQESYNQGLTSFITRDPERYKAALIETNRYTPEQVAQFVKQQHPTWEDGEAAEDPKPDATQSPVAPQVSQLDQMADQAVRNREKQKIVDRQTAYQDFLQENPEVTQDMDPVIASIASTLEDRGVSPKDAFNQAYLQAYKPEELVKRAKEDGELLGLAQKSSLTSMSSPTGTTPVLDKEPDVPDEEWNAAKAHFKDKAEYLKFTQSNVSSVAE